MRARACAGALAGALAAALLLSRPSEAAWFGAQERLAPHGDGAVLQRPLQDFYDTAFVFTDGGAAKPRILQLPELATLLARYDVVFFGESHGHPGVHLQQMRLMRALYERRPALVLSMEQFERDVQGVLDDYLADRVGENALLGAGRAWENYAASYRPMVSFAKDHGLPVVAAEAPQFAVQCVGQWGPAILAQFTPQERTWVATELHTDAGPYRDKFMQFQSGSALHGGGAASPEAAARAERSFAAQALRDDTMAESIATALQRHPGSLVLHLTGHFHSEGFLGTVERLRLRQPALKIAVLDALEVADRRAPGFDAADARSATVLQLVYPLPEPFAPGEDSSAWMSGMMAKHTAHRCKYALPAESGAAAPAAGAPGLQ
jgi:uncharacterized iron-regulated protein